MGDGINPATGQPYNTNDIFLLRSVPSIDFESGQPALYTGTSQQTAGDAFVAVLHAPLATTQNVDASGNVLTSPTQNFPVERINYDSALSGGVHVFGVGGNDYFAVDDNAASTYLTGGPGDTTFQIGQIYGERRTSSGTRQRQSRVREHLRRGHDRHDARLGQPRHERAARRPGGMRLRHHDGHVPDRQRHVHRLLQPGADPPRGRRRQQPVRGPRLRAGPDRFEWQPDPARGLQRDLDPELPAAAEDHQRLLDSGRDRCPDRRRQQPGRVQHERAGVRRRRPRLQQAGDPGHRVRRPHRGHRPGHLRRRDVGHLPQHPGDRDRRAPGRRHDRRAVDRARVSPCAWWAATARTRSTSPATSTETSTRRTSTAPARWSTTS